MGAANATPVAPSASLFKNGMLAVPVPPPGQPGFEAAKLKEYIGATSDLYSAVQAGDVEVCRAALSKGAEPGKQNHWKGNSTPLHVAAAVGSVEVCKLLLDQGGPGPWLDSKTGSWQDNSGETALAVAMRHQRPDVAELLQGRGATM
mmetsp:Transcript_40419/g.102711  ORF Transcript_40419/g.102711 Transcript_40419/m.102711 type:complete len:147 (+) Transcript_40419:31-471(+)